MKNLILSVLLFCVSYLISLYAWDKPKAPENIYVPIVEPKIGKIDERKQKDLMEKYIEKIILPYDRYRLYKYEFENHDRDEAISWFMQIAPFVLIFRSIFLHFESTMDRIVWCAIALAVCVLLSFILKGIYKKRLSVEEFSFSSSEISRIINEVEDCYCVGMEQAKSDQLMVLYHNYYYSISKTMRRRNALRYFLGGICGIIYFLFFFHIPA